MLGSPWWGRPAPKRRLMRRRPARGRMMLRASILMCEIRLKFNVEVREMERVWRAPVETGEKRLAQLLLAEPGCRALNASGLCPNCTPSQAPCSRQ